MRRVLITTALLSVLHIGAESTRAEDFWARMHLESMRMSCWPEPFSHTSRDLVRNPLVAMTNRGWQLQNTLSDHFFREEDQTLTQAGQFKLRWILTQAPAHRRTVFVLRSTDKALTTDRMAAVTTYVSRITEDGIQPNVLVSDIAPAGGAGEYFDQVDRQLKASIPPPRLPERTGFSQIGG